MPMKVFGLSAIRLFGLERSNNGGGSTPAEPSVRVTQLTDTRVTTNGDRRVTRG